MGIVGIDEVGRGCWAGPVVAGAVVLDTSISGLKDSKKLSKAQRETLAALINAHATVGLGWVGPAEVDRLGLTRAVGLAMERALAQINADYDEIIIDGHHNFLADNPKARAIIKADDTVPAVSAASIAAKVARDQYMTELVSDHDYGFAQHVGYGTALHIERLKQYGVSEFHRKSYKPIRQFLLESAA